jgi:hypothetical protein
MSQHFPGPFPGMALFSQAFTPGQEILKPDK